MAKNVPEYLETSDVARELDVSYSGVRLMVEDGRLQPVAKTRRGVKLFESAAVERLRRERAEAEREVRV